MSRPVLVLGASGGVGRHVVRIAAERGHDVVAVSRVPLDVPPGVRLVIGDVKAPGVIDAAMEGREVVLSSLGLKRVNPRNPWSPLASPPDLCSTTAAAIVDAMRRHGARRVVAVSAAGVGDSGPRMNVVMRALVAASNIGVAYRDLDRMERVYAASGLEACCARPTALWDGPPSGRVVEVDAFGLDGWIPRVDVATWLVDHAEGPLPANPTPTITAARA